MWSWNSRLGLQMKHAAPAPKEAWHAGRPTMRSIESAIASDGMLSDTDRWRWASRLPFPTSFANSPKRTCDRHQYTVRPKMRALRQTGAAATIVLPENAATKIATNWVKRPEQDQIEATQ